MSSEPLLASIIMATRNKASYLELTLNALERQTLPLDAWEIVVTDDASTDGTADLLARVDAAGVLPLHSRRSQQPRGRAGARNDALQRARGRVAVFLDDDRLVEPDFLLRHLVHHGPEPVIVIGDVRRHIHTHFGPGVDQDLWDLARLVAPDSLPVSKESMDAYRILRPEDLDNPDALTVWECAGPDALGELQLYRKQGVDPPPGWVYFTTGNASVLLERVRAVGGFDEDYQGWGLEDNDLALRLSMQGAKFRYEPDAVTRHQIHPKGIAQEEEHRRNLDLFFRKHAHLQDPALRLLLMGKMRPHQWVEKQRTTSESVEAGETINSRMAGSARVLWVVCGDGLAAASRSIGLYKRMRVESPTMRIRLASYGEGARWLARQGLDVLDLDGGARNPIPRRFRRLTEAVEHTAPDMLVADGELMALPVADVARVPAVFITDHFPDITREREAAYLRGVASILLPAAPGSLSVPPALFGLTHFSGPWWETVADPEAPDWRTLLNARTPKRLVVIAAYDSQPGHVHPLLEPVLTAASSTPQTDLVYVVFAGEAFARNPVRGNHSASNVRVLTGIPAPLSLFQQADLVIVPEGERTLLRELAASTQVPILVLTEMPTGAIPVGTDTSSRISYCAPAAAVAEIHRRSVSADRNRSAVEVEGHSTAARYLSTLIGYFAGLRP